MHKIINKHWEEELKIIAKRCIETEEACRANPCGWMSFHREDDPQYKEYKILRKAWQESESELWQVTDVEYDGKDPIRAAVWEWRYWKVMARKCCWYQRFGTTGKAIKTIHNLDKAESHMMELLGLLDLYKSPSEYIEEAFPKLKKVS